jgi:hypothetical protein
LPVCDDVPVTLRERSLRPKSLAHRGRDSSLPTVAQNDMNMIKSKLIPQGGVRVHADDSKQILSERTEDSSRSLYLRLPEYLLPCVCLP